MQSSLPDLSARLQRVLARVSRASRAAVALASLGGVPLAAQQADSVHATDTAFRAMQARGKMAMGIDQNTSMHRFDTSATGGRIELQAASSADTAAIARVRQHLRGISRAFAAGDFSSPMFVHMKTVPGTAVMAARRQAITYVMHDLPRGGEVVITTADPEALKAIHEFMAFQRGEHRAGGN